MEESRNYTRKHVLWQICVRSFNPLTTSVPHQIETSQLVCFANQLTGFYLMGNIGR